MLQHTCNICYMLLIRRMYDKCMTCVPYMTDIYGHDISRVYVYQICHIYVAYTIHIWYTYESCMPHQCDIYVTSHVSDVIYANIVHIDQQIWQHIMTYGTYMFNYMCKCIINMCHILTYVCHMCHIYGSYMWLPYGNPATSELVILHCRCNVAYWTC